MAIGPTIGMMQNMSLRQEMKMTPQMIQSMELLQLPIQALEQRIQEELLENPALEIAEMDEERDSSENNEKDSQDGEDRLPSEDDTAARTLDEVDYSWDMDVDEPAPRTLSRGYSEEDGKYEALYNTPGKSESLSEHLISQLAFLEITPRQRDIIEKIVYNLDDAGYLHIALSEISDPNDEDRPSSVELQECLEIVQSLEPHGIGARDLKECLLLQIKAKGKFYSFEYEMVDKYLDDLAANRLPKVARSMKCNLEDVKGVGEFLRTLNPHPGLEYGQEQGIQIIPDVAIRYDEGEFIISLNNGALPELRLSEDCQQIVQDDGSAEAKKYLRERLMSAEWIMRAIEQRNRTLLNVSRQIVFHQKDFFSGQSDRPGPLMMQTIADDVGIDISTVSRAVKEKYADTPRGVIALRDMFTRSVGGDAQTGEDSSSNVQIMNKIRKMVESEDPRKPLKDGQIVNLLKADGINIVRRTVAKYRQNLGIPSHSQRRQY